VLAAINDALGEDGRDLADQWSQEGDSYSKTDFRDAWKSIRPGGKVTVATLWHMALDAGWKPGDEAREETEAERRARERKRQKDRREAEQKAERERKQAAMKTAGLWKAATELRTDQGYFHYKLPGIAPPPTLREIPLEQAKKILGYHPQGKSGPLEGRLIVAPFKAGDKFTTMELIDEQGRKASLAGAGTKPPGCHWAAQRLPEGDGAGLLWLVGEGVATTLTGRAATEGNAMAVAAGSAANLPAVAKLMQERLPKARGLILGDLGNGQANAEQAAKATGAALAVPEFTPEQIQAFQAEHGKNPTDFNDLHQLAGLEAVQEQIQQAFTRAHAHKYTSYTSCTSCIPAASSLHQGPKILHPDVGFSPESCTDPLAPGALLFKNEKGEQKRIIESEAALILAGAMRGRFAYASMAAVWHRFTGTHWQPLQAAAEAEKFIASALYAGTDPIGFKPVYMTGIAKILLAADMLPLPPEPAGKIPFQNGLLDIETRQLKPATRSNAATWCIPHDYIDGAGCPLFLNWLHGAVDGDEGLAGLLRAWLNACIVGRADLQKFLHLLGPGGTGKSTFIRLLFAILGPENCATTDLRRLETNQFETSVLYGKRLAAITDSDKFGGAVNVLKALTGQDALRNERKHVQQTGSFIYTGTVIVASNEPLQSSDYTSGLERRRLVVPFDRRTTPEQKAAFLSAGGEERLHREIPGIVDWALGLSREQVTDIFMKPPATAQASAFEALLAGNPVAEWITHCVVPARGEWTQVGVKVESRTPAGTIVYEGADTRLFPSYLRWCRENGREALSLRRFRHTTMDMLGTFGAHVIESRRGAGQGIQGVRLKKEYEETHRWHERGVGVGSSYTSYTGNVGCDALQPAPVLDVAEMQDFRPTLFAEKKCADDAGEEVF
jgi:putative DNA primase/helicase